MGIYINPGNEGFRTARNGIYVDKSGLVGVINGAIDTKRKLSCISRPRRFGKSFAAQMLCAYYDRTCDSAPLFDDLAIAKMAERTGCKFVAIIDEWDALVRDGLSTGAQQKTCFEFLRSLFKSSGTTDKPFAAAYMTGILPIRAAPVAQRQDAGEDFERP